MASYLDSLEMDCKHSHTAENYTEAIFSRNIRVCTHTEKQKTLTQLIHFRRTFSWVSKWESMVRTDVKVTVSYDGDSRLREKF